MSTSKVPEMVLVSSSGRRSMPVIGIGTAAMPSEWGSAKQAFIEAIKLGYRHFDTAAVYGSEQAIGEAVIQALQLGLIRSRDEIFITSKIWVNENHPHLVIPAIKKSLQALRLEYLDLYLIHAPLSSKPNSPAHPIEENNLVPFDLKGVWTRLEECQRLGLTKSIGVSNFSRKKLEDLLSFAVIPPSVNQVEMNPTWQQKKLVGFCKENGIIITAYSPLGAFGTVWGTNQVMNNDLLKEVAAARAKTVPQVSLRWVYEQGVSFAVKSYNKERMKQNLEIFDWCLTEDDYEKINQIEQKRQQNEGVRRIHEFLHDDEDEE